MLGREEKRVLRGIMGRLKVGAKEYGPLDFLPDERVWLDEVMEELSDAMVYLEIHKMRTEALEPPRQEDATPVEQLAPSIQWLERCLTAARGCGMRLNTAIACCQWTLRQLERERNGDEREEI